MLTVLFKRAMTPTVTTYRMRLEGIRFRARHGVSPAERDLPQDFVVDLEVELPVGALPASDERACVYDYDKLATLVVTEGTNTSYKLLETLASKLLERVLSDTAALSAIVRLRKFGPPTIASVDTVAIELGGSR
jgi:7,8-dihydroneopterin aldolase/epimerase/oxygenase